MGFNYIVFSVPSGDMRREVPIIYPDFLVHSHVAEALQKVPGMENCSVMSAGSILVDALSCTGRSNTLDADSRGATDEKLINMFHYFHGLEENEP